MADEELRVGLIGAGGNVRNRHIPGFQQAPGLEILGVANGAQVHMRMSATIGLSRGNQIWMYGTEGTIHVDQQQNVYAGRRGDTQLTEISNPAEEQAHYRVEEEFTNAIRGQEQITMVPFETGVHHMEWTEAVFRSPQTGQAMSLPLSRILLVLT